MIQAVKTSGSGEEVRPVKFGCLTVKTSQGTSDFHGDIWEILAILVSGDLARIVALQATSGDESDLERSAQGVAKVFKAYFSRTKRLYRSRLSLAGLEVDTAKCYLQGLSISETVQWFETHKGFTVSESAIGRYWEVFREIGLNPLGQLTTG